MKKYRSLILVVAAALLLEAISVVQYFYMRQQLDQQLEWRAETELTMKCMVIKNMLDEAANDLTNFEGYLSHKLENSESLYDVLREMLEVNPNLSGVWAAFNPYYYKEQGRLFEPYAMRIGQEIKITQLANAAHDYTLNANYQNILQHEGIYWTDPYVDEDGSQELLCTCGMSLRDARDSLICLFGADLSLSWLSDTLDVQHIHPSSFVVLLTEEGNVISLPTNATDDGEQVISFIKDSTVVSTDSRSGLSRITRFRSDATGQRARVLYGHLAFYPYWRIGIVCYDNEVYAPLYRFTLIVCLLNLLALGTLLFIIWRFVRSQRRLGEARLAQAQMESELKIASRIQLAMLPRSLSADSSLVDVAATLRPARQVGGDLYNYFVRDDKLFFCIGDVSGKGIPSALVMATVQSVFQFAGTRENNPAHIVADLNAVACRNNKTNLFVTLFVGVLDLPTGHLRYCNAGHDAPLLLRDSIRPLSVEANLPIGVFDDTIYQQQETFIPRGTTLFLYTDGLTEAFNEERSQYGLERVREVLADNLMQSARQTLKALNASVRAFVGKAEQSDDLTLLALRYKGLDPSDYVLDERLLLRNDVGEVPRLNRFVADVGSRLGADDALCAQLKLAVEEAVANVIAYAYPKGVGGEIEVAAQSDGHALCFVISDEGAAFDPTSVAPSDTSLSAEERPIGGLGILLVRELMDTVNYERIDGRNILTLRKQL